jgi:hypothetical protein
MREAVPNRRYPLATTQAPVGCQYGRAHSETIDDIRHQLEADRESIGGAAVLPVVESPMAQEVNLEEEGRVWSVGHGWGWASLPTGACGSSKGAEAASVCKAQTGQRP